MTIADLRRKHAGVHFAGLREMTLPESLVGKLLEVAEAAKAFMNARVDDNESFVRLRAALARLERA